MFSVGTAQSAQPKIHCFPQDTAVIKQYLTTQVPPCIFSSWLWMKQQEIYVPVKEGQDEAYSTRASYIFSYTFCSRCWQLFILLVSVALFLI